MLYHGSEVNQPRSPLAEKSTVDSPSELRLYCDSRTYLSPRVLPPLRYSSGLLRHDNQGRVAFEDDDESVASAPDDVDANYSSEEDALGSSDSDLFEKQNSHKDDELFGIKSSTNNRQKSSLNRGITKENLRIEVPVNARRSIKGNLDFKDSIERRSVTGINHQTREDKCLRDAHNHTNGARVQQLPDMGTPSAPPIIETGKEVSFEEEEDNQWSSARSEAQGCSYPGMDEVRKEWQTLKEGTDFGTKDALSDRGTHSQRSDEPCTRDSMEAPEFLRDECMVLRNAFGLHQYLLPPRGQIPREARPVDSLEETCMVKAKKVVGKIQVEVRKVRIIPRRKLRSTYSQRSIAYMQAGVDYVRHVSALLKTGINSIKINSLPAATSEGCIFQYEVLVISFPENQGDALFVEVQENSVTQGRAIIQLMSLTDNPNDKVRWWPIYHEDNECVGKVQLSIISSSTCTETSSIKSGPVVETLAYDLVLEAAMRSQNFHPRNLRLHGPWNWLLMEFSDYYGVSDAYTKLRYLSSIMCVATPTKDCLELVYELLIPVVKAREEKTLTRQERSILLECETQVERLLENVFENYKSLDEQSPTGLRDIFGPPMKSAPPALIPAVQVYSLMHDVLAQEAQAILTNYLQTAAMKRCRRHLIETDEFMSNSSDCFLTDQITITTAYLKMKTLCINIGNEIQADIKIHNQHILPSSIDLPNIAAAVYSTQLFNRLRGFLAACPPAGPASHVTDLLIATADFERDLQSWNIKSVHGGVNSMNLFHHYIMVWVQDKRLSLLDLCKADKAPWSGITTNHSTSPFVEDMYEKIKDTLSDYEVVINRWPQYSLVMETTLIPMVAYQTSVTVMCLSLSWITILGVYFWFYKAIADIERAIIKAMERQYGEILAPLKDSIPKKLGMQVQKLTRRQSASIYHVPTQLGTFLNTVKRILDVLHCKVEDILKSWASCLPVVGERKSTFGEQLNGVTIMLRTKYKNYMQATVEKLINNTQANRGTRLKRILEETKETDGEAEVRERMQMLTSQLMESISNLHEVFSGRIFVAICRVFWDKMGQTVLSFLESRKENRIWYKGSYYALGVLDDTFASQMQRFQGNALQEKDLDPPRSVTEARSILCRDTPNTTDPSTYFYY
ncbi:hypothetical protein ACLOJK_015377 [Asimina triloba]